VIPSYEAWPVAKYEDLIAGEDGLLATSGDAWVLGDNITSDQLLPDTFLGSDPAAAARQALTALLPGFIARVKPGDFLVAGHGFGIDATHRTVPQVLKHIGIAAVIARSFGRFFLRNAVHVGLPALVVEETAAIKQGDRLRVDVEAHIVANRHSGDRYVIRNLDDDAIAILRAGGLVDPTRRHS